MAIKRMIQLLLCSIVLLAASCAPPSLPHKNKYYVLKTGDTVLVTAESYSGEIEVSMYDYREGKFDLSKIFLLNIDTTMILKEIVVPPGMTFNQYITSQTPQLE